MPKLLIIDDESDIRQFAQRYFQKRGIEVFTAAGGREGLEIISATSPDLVLLDMRMEEMSGIEVLQELRAKNLSTKVILVSGAEESEETNRARELGIIDFFHKPLDLEKLEKIVMAALGTQPDAVA